MFRKSLMVVVLYFLCFSEALSGTPTDNSIKIDSYTFGEIEARSIGPTVMGGRISAMDAVNKSPRIIYVGAAGGGVWKSIDGGASFKPIFDKYTQSIGAIAIDQAHPDTVWVGTGETWVRNSVSVGTGLYKTTDGGDNWTLVGLDSTERIGKIVINPQNPDIVYVAALGHLWNANSQRGVYKTTDGGKTWKKILYVDENTGCADLAMDPQEPDIVYAAMWDFRRLPHTFRSGGKGSGLYRTRDGGQTWKKIQNGIPKEKLGRIAVAVAPSRPSTVYAVIESKKTAMYRSDDLGEHWARLDSSTSIGQRPFYFSLLHVDPENYKRVYKPGYVLDVSNDGGESFNSRAGFHVDTHAFWVNPSNTNHLLLGTDGGVYTSFDKGSSWHFLNNIPVSQFYRVSYDMQDPYYVYGGLQDNGSCAGPSQSPGGIINADWSRVGYGDGFYVFVDPDDSDIIYREYQGGNISRYHKSTGESKDIKPLPKEGEPEYRFNWNTPIAVTNDAIYIGSQFLFLSTDKGESWTRISNDLTTNDPAKQQQEKSGGITVDNTTAENHCTIYTISVSPLNQKIIWAGTDDGNVQITRDGGESWENVVKNIPNLPKNTWCSSIEASRFNEGTAYATFDGHRTGDMNPYVYKTTDFGKTWQSLLDDAIRGYAFIIREDLEKAGLLFLGTEFGLFLSIDGGEQWAQFTGKLPNVAVRDIAIHPREADVILGTHGRGIYIIDDLDLLRNMTHKIAQKKIHLFETPTTYVQTLGGDLRYSGPDEFAGNNPSEVAKVIYFMKKRHMFGDLKVEIFDADGKMIKSLPGGKRRGINIVNWQMRLKPPKVAPAPTLAGAALFGPLVPEGVYTANLIKGKDTLTTDIEIRFDPSSPHSPEDRALQQKTVWKLYRMQEELAYVAESLTQARDDARGHANSLKKGDGFAKDLNRFADKLDQLHKTLVATRKVAGITGERQLREKVVELYGSVSNFYGRPTESQLSRVTVLEKEIKKSNDAYRQIIEKDLEKINKKLQGKDREPIKIMTKEEWDKKQQS